MSSSRISHALVMVGLLLIQLAVPVAQSMVEVSGAWSVNGSQWGRRVAAPGGFPVTLLLRVSESEVTIQRNGGASELYVLGGSETTLPDARIATARVEDGALHLIFTRTRGTPAQPYTITARELYRLTGATTLTLERSYLGRQATRWTPVQRVTYRRDP